LRITPYSFAQNGSELVPGLQPTPSYDEQLFEIFDQAFNSIAYNVTAVNQTGAFQYGPAYLVNGMSNKFYWYQVGLFYDWPGAPHGFSMAYEVFNILNRSSIFPVCSGGCGGVESFNGPINPGDQVALSLNFSDGNVVMSAYDWNTSASASVDYSAAGGNYFFGGIDDGFFTGLMTEQYHASPYFGTEQPVIYTLISNGLLLSGGAPAIDEYCPNGTCNTIIPFTVNASCEYCSFSSNSPFFVFNYANTSERVDANQFVTGNFPLTIKLRSQSGNDIAAGQKFVINSTISNGTAPYSYQWVAGLDSNDLTASEANALLGIGTSGGKAQSPNAIFTTNSTNTFDSYKFKLNVIDTASLKQNAVMQTSNALAVTVLPFSVMVSPSNSTLDAGQSETYTVQLTGGVGPFYVQFYNITGGRIVGNLVVQNPGGSNTISFFTSNVGVFSFNAIVTDSGLGNYVLNSATNSITVSSDPIASVSTVNTVLDVGQVLTYNAVVIGGTGPFTVNLILNGTVIATNTVSEPGGNALLYYKTASSTANTFSVIVNDLGTTTQYSFNAIPNAVNIDPAPVVSISPINTTLDVGQSVVYNAVVIGGTGPFTVNLLSDGNVIATNTVASSGGSAMLSYNLSAVSTNTFYAVGTDLGTTAAYVFSSPPNSLAVSNTPVLTLSQSNTTLDAGQTETYTIGVSGGVGPFEAKLYNTTGNSLVVNTIIDSPGGSNTISFVTSNSGIFDFKAVAVDTGTTSAYNLSTVTKGMAVNKDPFISINALTTRLDVGQTLTYNVVVNGGTGPFTVNLVSSGNVLATDSIGVVGGNALLTYKTKSVYGTFNVTAVDTGTSSQYTFNSPPNTVDIANAPTIALHEIGTSILDINKTALYEVEIPANSGFGPFTVNLMVGGNIVATNTILAGVGNAMLSFIPNSIGNILVTASGTDNGVGVPYIFNSSEVTTEILPTLNTSLTIEPNTISNVIFSDSNAIILISTNSLFDIPINVLISNVTQAFSSLPSHSGTSFNKIVLINVSLSYNAIAGSISSNLTIGYPCSDPGVAPYILRDGLWEEITPFTTNSASCTLNFSIPADPVVGLFSSQETGQSGGGGGGGGGGFSGGGGGGGGAAPAPVNITINGAEISYIEQLKPFNATTCSSKIIGSDNFIAPNDTGVTVDGIGYTLYPLIPQQIEGLKNCYIELLNISWEPIAHLVSIYIYDDNGSTGLEPNRKLVNRSLSSFNGTLLLNKGQYYYINFTNSNALLIINPKIKLYVNAQVDILNDTNSTPNLAGMRKIVSVSESVSSKGNFSLEVGFFYNCSLNDRRLGLYELHNESWNPVNDLIINQGACEISFNSTSDPIIGLFENTTNGNSAKRNVSKTTLITTSITSTVIESSVTNKQNETNSTGNGSCTTLEAAQKYNTTQTTQNPYVSNCGGISLESVGAILVVVIFIGLVILGWRNSLNAKMRMGKVN
jgi:uncharacterized membrane protein YgcG